MADPTLLFLLLAVLLGAVAGFLGGKGGHLAASLQLRREVAALAAAVDPAALAELTRTPAQLEQLSARLDGAQREIKTLAGRFGQEVRKATVGPEDLDFIVAAVAAKLKEQRS